MLKRYFLVLAVMITPLFVLSSPVSAVNILEKNVCDRSGASSSPVCKDNDGARDNPLYGPQGILTSIINLLSLIVGIIALIIILLAGLKFITSGNNPQDVTNARERVIYACVALVVASLAQVFVRFIIGKVSFL